MRAATLRYELKPGDLGAVSRQHALLYAAEYGLDASFEPYVAAPLAAFALARARDGDRAGRLWLAEDDGALLGTIAIVRESDAVAQLRWFLLDTASRGRGLGRRLVGEVVRFAGDQGFRGLFLWTFSELLAARHLYESFGFQLSESRAVRQWGRELTEERYDLSL